MHRSMELPVRCENAVTGFLVLDLYRLMADKLCTKRLLPKGSLWLAPQTHVNLQNIALGTISVCLSKDPESGDYWKGGHCRMCELGVEEWFGILRSRSITSQLTSRAYWRSAAKEMIRCSQLTSRKAKIHNDQTTIKPISDEEWVQITKRSLKAAIELVAWSSGVTPESLRSKYLAFDGYQLAPSEVDPELLHEWERDEQETWEDEMGAASKCEELLNTVKAGVQEDHEDETQEAEADQNAEASMDDGPVPSGTVGPYLGNLPDADQVHELLTSKGDASSPFCVEQPLVSDAPYQFTLAGALATSLEETGSRFDALWRLCMYLRYWKQGGDQHWLKNPRACRRMARCSTWYRFLERFILAFCKL